MLLDKADACLTIGDAYGAIDCCDQALRLMLSPPPGSGDFDLQICRALMIKGKSQQDIMQDSEALDTYQTAAGKITSAVGPHAPPEVITMYSDICGRIALTLWNLKRSAEALDFSRKSINILNAYQNTMIDNKYRVQKTAAHMINYAIYSASAGMFEDEINYLNESIELIRKSKLDQRDTAVRTILASALMNRACVLGKRQQHTDAIPDYIASMRLIESIVRKRSTPDWRRKQSSNYNNYAQTLAATGQPAEAIRYVRKAIRIIRLLSRQEGFVHHYPELARSYLNLTGMYTHLKKYHTALRQIDRSIRIMEHLIKEYQKIEMMGEYAFYLITRASLMIETGRKKDARILLDRALPLLDQEIERTGNPQLKDIRHWAQTSVLRRL